MSVAKTWGTTADERALAFPCDALLPDAEATYYRGVTVDAPAAIVFRWLCQLRVASYSYTSRGAETLTPGLEQLAPGQTFMGVFELVEFERDRHLTMRLVFKTREGRAYSRALRDFVLSYLVVPQDGERCRLLLKYLAKYRRGPLGWLGGVFVPWLDLAMARKQLLTLKRLAERSARANA
jgi:hypothetical protein